MPLDVRRHPRHAPLRLSCRRGPRLLCEPSVSSGLVFTWRRDASIAWRSPREPNGRTAWTPVARRLRCATVSCTAKRGRPMAGHSIRLWTYAGSSREKSKPRKIRVGISGANFNGFSDDQADFAGTSGSFPEAATSPLRSGALRSKCGEHVGAVQNFAERSDRRRRTYQVIGQRLRINTTLNDVPIDVYVSNNGTQVDNVRATVLWIAPSDGTEVA